MITYIESEVNREWHIVVWVKSNFPRLFNKLVILLLNIKCKNQKDKYWGGDFSIVPLFKQVEIETVNICNNDCPFCPVSVNNDIREHKRMDEELFDKIIGELSTIDYDGIINLFSNNEPLIDDRIVAFAQKTRALVPNSKICIYTNGKLLTQDIFSELLKYVSFLQIDVYSDNMEIDERLGFVLDACKKDEHINKLVNVCVMRKNQIRSSRGGNAPNKRNIGITKCKCILPLHEMTIRSDGRVSMCCNDAYGEVTLGDVNSQNIIEIWESEVYKKYRQMLFEGRGSIKVCRQCDSVDFGRDKFWSKI